MLTKHKTLILRNRYFMLLDILFFVLSAYFSFTLRFESFSLPQQALQALVVYLLISLPLKISVFYTNGMYRQYWNHAGSNELLLIASSCIAVGIGVVLILMSMDVLFPQFTVSYSPVIIDFLLITVLVTGSRFSLRTYQQFVINRQAANTEGLQRVFIVGAGQTGIQVLEGLLQRGSSMKVIGFLDDDLHKLNTYIRGIRILGTLSDLGQLAKEYDIDLIIIAIPSASGKLVRQIMLTCQEIGIQHRTVPGMYELATGKVSVNTLRPISIEDLLRRDPIHLDIAEICQRMEGVCVMVTGAGGSIGSEISLQIAQCNPKNLVLLGHGENSLFAIENKIKTEFPDLNHAIVLADVQDKHRLSQVFSRYEPRIVFHAAAHKHVPMLESNVASAISNNVLGTRNLIDLCNQFNVERMIMISTDKAVEPTNVMGMTKRVAEILIMNAAQENPKRFAVVRFGNVLGSRGSVVPIFQQQIALGVPITITSDKMTRFFMSIPEAVLLVLKASLLVDYGPLFVLNMGEPVKIIDLARDLIRLNGLEPERDIEIKITQIRPGEKLYEELFWKYEKYSPIENGAIYALERTPERDQHFSTVVQQKIDHLLSLTMIRDEKILRNLLDDIVWSEPDVFSTYLDSNIISMGSD